MRHEKLPLNNPARTRPRHASSEWYDAAVFASGRVMAAIPKARFFQRELRRRQIINK